MPVSPHDQPPHQTPHVTAAFLTPLASCRFVIDHIETLGRVVFRAAIQHARPALQHADAQVEQWMWVRDGMPAVVYAIDLATFRSLASAKALPDGTVDVAGTIHKLAALITDDGLRIARLIASDSGSRDIMPPTPTLGAAPMIMVPRPASTPPPPPSAPPTSVAAPMAA
jgi:hypothetical protein